MGRYTGPVCRLCRRAGEKLFLKGERCLSPKCGFEKRSTPPGHVSTRRRRVSERGIQLREKQKARWIYGLLERQMSKTYAEAKAAPGMSGETLMQTLERRLDNVVYRAGFADSRAQARQLVRNGHISVNSRKLDIPSAILKVGDTVGFNVNKEKNKYYQARVKDLQNRPVPAWLSVDTTAITGKVLSLPQPQEIDTKIETRLIVEYYSR